MIEMSDLCYSRKPRLQNQIWNRLIDRVDITKTNCTQSLCLELTAKEYTCHLKRNCKENYKKYQ